jgi:hypothetical protein
MKGVSELLDWPDHIDRTPSGERTSTSKFDTSFSKTRGQLKKEMARMDVDEWRLEDVTGSHGDPGVVVRWLKDGDEYAAACDYYTSKKDNIRSVYLWLKETRKRNDRPVETAEDNFAAARLPSGQPIEADGDLPHEVLEVPQDATEEEVRDAYREKAKDAHDDQGGSTAEMVALNSAKEAMLNE